MATRAGLILITVLIQSLVMVIMKEVAISQLLVVDGLILEILARMFTVTTDGASENEFV